MRRGVRAAWLGIFLVVFPASTLAADAPASLADCDDRVRNDPGSLDAYLCFPMVARMKNQHAGAARRLEALLAVEPTNNLARLVLAHVEADQGRDRAEALYREAADGFASQGRRMYEVNARLGLSFFLALRGRLDESETELRMAAGVARDADDPAVMAPVRIHEAWAAYRRADYGGAERILREVEPSLSPDASPRLRSDWLSALGAALWGMARLRDSLDAYRTQSELLHSMGDLYEEASALSNVALLTSLADGSNFTAEQLENQVRLSRRALEVAVAGGNRRIEGWGYQALAQLSTDCRERRRFLTKALPALEEVSALEPMLLARRTLGLDLATCEPRDLERAFRLLEKAVELARSRGDLQGVARGKITRARVEWRLSLETGLPDGDRDRAIAYSLAALDAIEAIRDMQAEAEVRARTFSAHSEFYDIVTGHLLGLPGDSPSPEDLTLAFQIMERRRARVLLDELDAARITSSLFADVPEAAGRAGLLGEIFALRGRLRSSDLSPQTRAEVLAELDHLQSREAALRRELARSIPLLASFWGSALASVGEVQEALADHEALLSYQIADSRTLKGDFRGGSWVHVITESWMRAYPLPDEQEIEASIDLLLDLLQNRDGSEAEGAARLHAAVLEPVLEDLPAGVTHLILIPDGPLHRLPFGALRPAPEAQPLGTLLQLSIVPSATTWLRWRKDPIAGPDVPALALVDPALPGLAAASPRTEPERSGESMAAPTTLGPLPHARQEGRAVLTHLANGSRSLAGDAATERSLKEANLSRYGLVHLAAHALVDEREPSRSMLFLAAGPGDEDGRLEYREVASLDLGGRAVVLSACRSASGAVLGGEGVMSLARAFFVSGAHAVIGSLWPLRDDEAARFFDDFYRHLGRGVSLGEALAAARRDRIAAGVPTAAWAGLVLLGDGRLVPLPGGHETLPLSWWQATFILMVIAVAAAGRGLHLYRRRNAGESPGWP